jgi:DNA-binding MarR family transcriptional regulator
MTLQVDSAPVADHGASASHAPWLTDEEQRVWRGFAGLLALLPHALDMQLQRDADMSHFSYWILAMLSEAPEHALRMSELAEQTHASQSRLSHMVARLEGRGWVLRRPSEDDGRGNVAVLTEAGLDKVIQTAPGHVQLVRSLVFDALTPAQRAQLGRISSAVLDRVDAHAKLRR